MKFVANGVNGKYLRECLPPADVEVDGVLAAIAYGSDDQSLLKDCLDNKRRLDIWMRYDHTVPVSIPLLQKLLNNQSRNIFCYQVPDVLHAKVIWWRGYGAYIGSANLSDRAWISNIEAGVFLEDGELHESGAVGELEYFFDGLKDLDRAFPLTQEVVDELGTIQTIRKQINDINEKSKKKRTVEIFQGLGFIDKNVTKDRKKSAFRTEWLGTMEYLRTISREVVNCRPSWVAADVPAEWQADQFLHAYYYNHVRDGHSYPVEEHHERNRKDPNRAMKVEMEWWRKLSSPPTSEDTNFEVNAPFIRNVLKKENIDNIDVNRLEQLCIYTHATREHVKKVPLSTVGGAAKAAADTAERLSLYAKWLWLQENTKGERIVVVLRNVLYGGRESELWERLYKYGKDAKYKIPHYGLNSLAEVVGWARPDVMPPRNGRTSKALRALGYDVKIY